MTDYINDPSDDNTPFPDLMMRERFTPGLAGNSPLRFPRPVASTEKLSAALDRALARAWAKAAARILSENKRVL